MHKIEVYLKEGTPDSRGNGLVKDIEDLGITGVKSAHVTDIYWLDGKLVQTTLEKISSELLSDPITQEYIIDDSRKLKTVNGSYNIKVAHNAGVMDPVEDTILKALSDLGINQVSAVRTGKRYIIDGELDAGELEIISNRLLINPIIQHIVEKEPTSFPKNPTYKFRLRHVNLLNADDKLRSEICSKLGFSVQELDIVTEHYKKLKRNPTDAELETFAQTWSEHCVHKTFRAKINCNNKVTNNLLRSTIAKATRELNKPWCLSVFEDNSGVIEFDNNWAVCMKVETHNHPSAVEPYGGAATGIGGVVRDILGTGLSAKPVLNTDVFCFGPPDLPYEDLPAGVLHPKRTLKGVRAGVADYGNRLGIPTVNGAVLFDKRYIGNPLVYCGTVGIMPKDCAKMGKHKAGDLILLVGGKTGRDGIHGVTFASEELTDESTDVSFTAVQIGNPIIEKKVIDTVLQARDKKLFNRITDCGGGGLSSAIGEMGKDTGARVYLDRVPLKYSGLSYEEIWISESQERMVLSVPPDNLSEILKIFAKENVEATTIGEFTDDKKLTLHYGEAIVADVDMEFLHNGLPQRELKAEKVKPKHEEPVFAQPKNLGEEIKAVLSAWNISSKEWIIRQYDHEVQGGSVIKPLVGKESDGPSDAAVARPILHSHRGIVVSNGINPSYGDISPYWMAASAIDEALRQIIAVGGSLERVALLDNFSWGNTSKPENLGALVSACQACHDLAVIYGTPFISGKDSLNNEYRHNGEAISIPHTLLVSAIAVMSDTSKAITMDLKKSGNLIYMVGRTFNELGGSEYFKKQGYTGNSVPKVQPRVALNLMNKLSEATSKRLVKSCHDLSDGGLATAISEMAFAGRLGADIDIKKVPLGESFTRDDYILFSESNSRFLVEVEPKNQAEFEQVMEDVIFDEIGKVTDNGRLTIKGTYGDTLVDEDIEDLREAWQKPLGQ